MLFSLALIIIIGFSLSSLFNKFKVPGLLGMILTGILLGPYVLNLIVPEILNISADLRQIALIVILLRAGLSLDIDDLKKVGRPALLMCFVPATFELLAVTILAPIFLNISYLEAAILGAVLAAVSPAVIVPRMIKLMEEGYGTKKSIPQLIMAGASVDDVFVIVLFTSFLNMYNGGDFSVISLLSVPISVLLGLLLGILTALILIWVFKKVHLRDTMKVLLILSVCFLLVHLEAFIKPYISISALLAVMAIGGTICKKENKLSQRLMNKFSKIWVAAEIILFVLVGATVDISYLSKSGVLSIVLILLALVIRIIGVNVCLIKTPLNEKERLFCSIAYLPKATVQAAIGAIPLASGVVAGNTILTIAILAIIITAPLGALGIDLTYKKFLEK